MPTSFFLSAILENGHLILTLTPLSATIVVFIPAHVVEEGDIVITMSGRASVRQCFVSGRYL